MIGTCSLLPNEGFSSKILRQTLTGISNDALIGNDLQPIKREPLSGCTSNIQTEHTLHAIAANNKLNFKAETKIDCISIALIYNSYLCILCKAKMLMKNKHRNSVGVTMGVDYNDVKQLIYYRLSVVNT